MHPKGRRLKMWHVIVGVILLDAVSWFIVYLMGKQLLEAVCPLAS